IGVSILGVILTNGRGSLQIYLLHAIEVTLIATLCGGWTGNELTKYIHTQKNSITLSSIKKFTLKSRPALVNHLPVCLAQSSGSFCMQPAHRSLAVCNR